MQSWVWVGVLAWQVAACGGKAATSAAGAAGPTSTGNHGDDAVSVGPSAGGSSSIGVGAGGPVSVGVAGSAMSVGGLSSVGVGGSAIVSGDAGAGGEGGEAIAASALSYVSKLLGAECPAELCAGTVAASDCAALPDGVVRTSEGGCDGLDGQYKRIRTLTFEFSKTRRKACYYSQADDFETPPLLVGAEAWDDQTQVEGPVLHERAGIRPSADCRFPTGPNTLCDLQDPKQDPPRDPNVPARGCFDAFSATCEPCCAAEDKNPDCTGKPNGYPGFDCTPPLHNGRVSYCACSCYDERWDCEC